MLKKDITFIYMDSAEKAIYEPIAEEAKKRGYKVKLTDNKFEKCEIGFYCQHVNFPQYSRFSLVMLHDIIQQYGNWPDIWLREPWNKYDIGILPSDQWVKNWDASSQWYYANPRIGMYKIGWPKADSVADIDVMEYKQKFCLEHGLDLKKKTILYAPAWENDHKQDDFVQAMLQLDVNILIKQYNATPELQPLHYKNNLEMYELHKNIKGVTILDPKTNIFDAIIVADVLVSEESSTMAEAIMMGIPAVSVSDWLIPDVTPSRMPECNYNFVIATKKEGLKDCISEIVAHYDKYKKQACNYRDKTFCNIGRASKMIMNIVDDCVAGKDIRYDSLKAKPHQKVSFNQYAKHKYLTIGRSIENNYCIRYRTVSKLWEKLRKIKRIFIKGHIR